VHAREHVHKRKRGSKSGTERACVFASKQARERGKKRERKNVRGSERVGGKVGEVRDRE